MRENRVKRVMREGGLALVSQVGFTDPAVVEIIAVYHPALYLTSQDLVQMGVNYTSVAPPPPTIVLNALRDSARRIREETAQRVGV